MQRKNDEQKRPEAYPKPSETDNQWNNQAEYIDQQPNEFDDQSISDTPGSKANQQVNDPTRDSDRGGE